jgi:radical SAM superfamily enzyme YgiQ (UPF0313 family)
MRSPANVMREVGWLADNYRIDGFWLLDDTLLEQPDWTLEFCRQLHAAGYGLSWGCQAHVLRIRDDLLRSMKAAGCVQVEFGVESGSPRILKRLRKGTTPDQIVHAFQSVRAAGMRTLANFMIGNPGETLEDLELTFRLAKRIKPDHVVATFTTPLPGSALYDDALQQGVVSPDENFSEGWLIRQTENPAVRLSRALSAHDMKRFRSRLDNHFWLVNHGAYLKRPEFLAGILAAMAKRPRPYLSGLAAALRTRRLGHFIETVWDEYNRV